MKTAFIFWPQPHFLPPCFGTRCADWWLNVKGHSWPRHAECAVVQEYTRWPQAGATFMFENVKPNMATAPLPRPRSSADAPEFVVVGTPRRTNTFFSLPPPPATWHMHTTPRSRRNVFLARRQEPLELPSSPPGASGYVSRDSPPEREFHTGCNPSSQHRHRVVCDLQSRRVCTRKGVAREHVFFRLVERFRKRVRIVGVSHNRNVLLLLAKCCAMLRRAGKHRAGRGVSPQG